MSSIVIHPYTVSNSYKGGFFMRQYTRNVRRAWDGEDYRPLKRMRVDHAPHDAESSEPAANQENMVDVEDNLERAIRETSVAAMSSSPSRKNSTVFSGESHTDDASSTITPPSSPVFESALQLTPPKGKPRKPTFSFLDKSKKEKPKPQSLKRKNDASTSHRERSEQPLSEIHNNSARASSTAPSTSTTNNTTRPTPQPTFPGLVKPAQASLTQTRLDFGQSLAPVTCPSPDCAMTYTPSSEADTTMHNMYHNRHSQGIDLGKPFLKSAMKWCYEVPSIPGSVVVVDRKISLPSRKTVHKVLEVVNRELGSVDISEEELWSQRPVPGETDESRKCDRYKVFLHVINGKCVAIALAERISRLRRVLPSSGRNNNGHGDVASKMDLDSTPAISTSGNADGTNNHEAQYPTPSPTASEHTHHKTHQDPESQPLQLSQESYPAVVGVSRIWTSKTFRRQGIANTLLDCVVNQFIYGMEIKRDQVAFSQPTDMGRGLAGAWFEEQGKEGSGGWGVYVED